jgi:hypothetical protein
MLLFVVESSADSLRGAFFVSAGVQFYLYLAAVPVPHLGRRLLQPGRDGRTLTEIP